MRIVGFEPCFRVVDVDRAVAHYQRLGFGLTIHLAHDDDPTHRKAMLYILVDDADELAHQWRAAGVDVDGPTDTDYGKREGAHFDPDENLIRFGSPIPR